MIACGLLLLTHTLMSACGSEEEINPKQASHQVILSVSQLPPGTKAAKEPLVGEKCSPASYFRAYAAAVAVAPGFYLPTLELIQQVGVFDSASDARRAFREVSSESALACIGHEMQATAVSFTSSKGRLESRTLMRRLPGTTSRTLQLQLRHAIGQVEVVRTAFLNGRGLTTLTFILQNRRLRMKEWRSLSRLAAGSLSEAIGSLAN